MPHSTGKSGLLFAAFLQNIDGLGVAYTAEVVGNNVLKTLKQALIDEGVEKLHFLRAALDDGVYDVLDHRLGVVHVVVEIGKGHLGLYHPELGSVALSVGHLGAEGRAEGIYITEGHGKIFALSWPETVGLVTLPKKSLLSSTLPSSRRGGC